MLNMPVRRILLCCLLAALWMSGLAAAESVYTGTLAELEARIESFVPDPGYPDDVYGLIMARDAVTSLKEGSGGIAACLVDARTGKVVERGRNRQTTGYFRSDLHAEMDLLNRYEERVRKPVDGKGGKSPRDCGDLVLYSSLEPCPMCLTRIINAGIRRMYYVSPDRDGGMVRHMEQLPKFWREFAAGRDFGQARCSPAMQQIAADLFSYSMRGFVNSNPEQ